MNSSSASDFAPDTVVSTGAVALTDWGVIRASGADAASFLHGQLTNDIAGLDASGARLAGFCSPKGRLLASFVVWRDGADEVLLACHASVLPATLKRLSMFVMRAKCRLTDATADLPLFGVAGAAADTLVGAAPPWQRVGDAIRLPDAAGVRRCLTVGTSPVDVPAMALADWRWLDVQSGVPTIEIATQDQFVPQMVNFELVGGVDFQKGCYPGQEIVARSQYRGTVKRRLFRFDVAATAHAGQEVFDEADGSQPAGMVANAAPSASGGSSLLVEVKLNALVAGPLRLGTVDGAVLERRELPYAVSAQDDTAA